MEGKLYRNECGKFEIDDFHWFSCGCRIELCLCGVWVLTRIEHDGNDYYAVGLKGLKLDGLLARNPLDKGDE